MYTICMYPIERVINCSSMSRTLLKRGHINFFIGKRLHSFGTSSSMENLVNSVKSVALSVGEKFVPVLRETRFRETGVLTPEEFVAAGDHLVHHCPTWSWARATDRKLERDYLPAKKQFLITRRVPCHRRCAQIDYDPHLELLIRGTFEFFGFFGDTALLLHASSFYRRRNTRRMGRHTFLFDGRRPKRRKIDA